MKRRQPSTGEAERLRCARLNQRLRQVLLDGAEEDSRRRLGRGLTAEELEGVMRRYPGGPFDDSGPES
jgi:hypothetical protein